MSIFIMIAGAFYMAMPLTAAASTFYQVHEHYKRQQQEARDNSVAALKAQQNVHAKKECNRSGAEGTTALAPQQQHLADASSSEDIILQSTTTGAPEGTEIISAARKPSERTDATLKQTIARLHEFNKKINVTETKLGQSQLTIQRLLMRGIAGLMSDDAISRSTPSLDSIDSKIDDALLDSIDGFSVNSDGSVVEKFDADATKATERGASYDGGAAQAVDAQRIFSSVHAEMRHLEELLDQHEECICMLALQHGRILLANH